MRMSRIMAATKSSPKILYHLMFEDYREEVNNQASFIGIFKKNEITVSTIPTNIPKLCFHVVFGNVTPKSEMFMEIKTPENKTIFKAPKPHIISLDSKFSKTCVVQTIFEGLRIEKAGIYKFLFRFGEDSKSTQELQFQVKEKNKSKSSN